MANDDPDLIVRLIPLNERTNKAWKDRHNAHSYQPASFQGFEHREGSSRDTTPFEGDISNEDKKSDSEPEIRLMLDNIPKDVAEGIVFGGNKEYCDIYCGDWSKNFNISGRTFSITVNKDCKPVLKYLSSKSRISVQYGDQGPGIRAASTWVLFPGCRQGITIKVAEQLEFRVVLPKHGTNVKEYFDRCFQYLRDVKSSAVPFRLSMNSQPVTIDPSRIPTPCTKPFYYRCMENQLGRASSGKVYLVYDASTGQEYAGKEFCPNQNDYKECRILAQLNHKRIIQFVDFTHEGGSLLVMERAKNGTLDDHPQSKYEDPWTAKEIAEILRQCLRALVHLHNSAHIIIHRDIKPRKILVHCRYAPLAVKLGGFSVAVEGYTANGQVGDVTYAAPEVFSDGPYDERVDIWSLGVVVMKLLLGGRLPKPADIPVPSANWCSLLETVAGKGSLAGEQKYGHVPPASEDMSAALWSFIAKYMVKVDPSKRLSAKELLDRGRETVFSIPYQESDSEYEYESESESESEDDKPH